MTVGRTAANRCRPLLAGLGVLASLVVSGCKEVEATAASAYRPATVEEVGDLGLKRVTFTPEGAANVDLQLATAQAVGGQTVVPYAALIYDGQGVTWVFTNTGTLAYERVRVVVDRIEGDRVLLSDGLKAGTRVVTVGATEVYGAELNIEGNH